MGRAYEAPVLYAHTALYADKSIYLGHNAASSRRSSSGQSSAA